MRVILKKLKDYRTLNILSYIGLSLAALYSGIKAAAYATLNTDYMVNADLFSNIFRLGEISLPGDHSNIAKFPLFALEGALPYSQYTIFATNLIIYLSSIFLITFLLKKITGTKYIYTYTLPLSIFLLASAALPVDLMGDGVRNIEYAASILFIYVMSRYLKEGNFTRKTLFLISIIIFYLVASGDTFILYTVVGAGLLVVFLSYMKSKNLKPSKPQLVSAAILLAALPVAILLRLFATTVLDMTFYTESYLKPSVIPIDQVPLIVEKTSTAILNLTGSNIFGKSIETGNSIVFFSFVLLIISVCGIIGYLRKPRMQILPINFILLWSLLVVLLAGISGLIIIDPDGDTITVSRYLSLIPFVLPLGFIFLIEKSAHKGKVVLSSLIIAGLLTIPLSLSLIRDTNGLQAFRDVTSHATKIAKTLDANDTHFILGGYWGTPVVRLVSEGSIHYAPIRNCEATVIAPFNSARFQFTDNISDKSALLVGIQGFNDGIRIGDGCTKDNLIKRYGEPSNIISTQTGESLETEVWLYNYDLRSKIDMDMIQYHYDS